MHPSKILAVRKFQFLLESDFSLAKCAEPAAQTVDGYFVQYCLVHDSFAGAAHSSTFPGNFAAQL